MNGNRTAARGLGCAARVIGGLALWAALASGAGAQLPPPAAEEAQAWPEAETVRTLLRADAAAALADCRISGICPVPEVASPAAEPAASSARPADDIRVLAIFGIARNLRADLNVNGALLRYQSGRGAPIAGSSVADAYQLLAIEDACVRLRRGGRERTACLDLGGGHP